MSKAIPLIVLKSVIVDDLDYELLKHIIWYVSVSNGKMYARRQTQKSRPVGETWMHRIIANTPPGMVTHHRNGNTLDNRRMNLLVMTQKAHAALRSYQKNPENPPS